MDKSPPPQRWYQRRRTDPGHVSDDAADLGTAFGLDLSLRDLPPDAAQPTFQADPLRPPATAAAAGKPSWGQRVLGRSRTR